MQEEGEKRKGESSVGRFEWEGAGQVIERMLGAKVKEVLEGQREGERGEGEDGGAVETGRKGSSEGEVVGGRDNPRHVLR